MKRKQKQNNNSELMYELNEMYTSILPKHSREHNWVGSSGFEIFYIVALTDIFRVDIREGFKKEILLYLTEEEVDKMLKVAKFWIEQYDRYNRAYFRYVDLVFKKKPKEKIKWERIW